MKQLKALKPLGELRLLVPHVLPESDLPDNTSDNPEDAARQDHINMMRGLREQQAASNEMANESAFWFAAYFQTKEQRDLYLQAKGAPTDSYYVDGLALAAADNISLPERTVKYKTGTLDKKCAALAR